MRKQFVYLVAEGVLDVVFLTQVLRSMFGVARVARKRDLPEAAARWIDGFKWPVGDDIARLAVPAPVFLQDDRRIIGIRNSGGLSGVRRTMRADFEAFPRIDWHPDAVGVVLDSDDEPPSIRFNGFAEILRELGLPRPSTLETVVADERTRAGIYGFPGGGAEGTIEDVLLPVAESRFPDLFQHASSFVDDWHPSPADDYSELDKPSGRKKARLSSMAALLKPGKSLNPSIEDQRWLPADLTQCWAIASLVRFLQELCPEPTEDESTAGSDQPIQTTDADPPHETTE